MAKEKEIFVDREAELKKFQNMLQSPYGVRRILLLLGNGGIGKTRLIRRMLEVAHSSSVLVLDEPIDVFSTDYRHIDGIQWRIKEIVENLPELKERRSPFAEWVKGKSDTSEKFYECLKNFCAEHPLVLAFDTFENLDKVASDWMFKSEPDGLQVPGLICIVAGRDDAKIDINSYRKNPLVNSLVVSGFSYDFAEDFFNEIATEVIIEDSQSQRKTDLLAELVGAAGLPDNVSQEDSIEWVWRVTDGHPLRLEMVFRWLRTLLRQESLKDVTVDEFEERLMKEVRDLAERDQLDAGMGKKVSQPVFDTLLCMAHITRRFDEGFLRYLADKGLIRLEGLNVTLDDVTASLKRYFFVKVREIPDSPHILQLHDEMARLVQKYVWPYYDNSGKKKQALFEAVEQYYEQLIAGQSGEEADTLRVEKLYYIFQRDWEDGRQRWLELAELGNENMNKLLPGEIKSYLDGNYYDKRNLVEIHSKIAEMEYNAEHIKQAVGHWEKVKKLGESNRKVEWEVDALIGMFNCKVKAEPEEAYRSYLLPAQKLCESHLPDRMASIDYEIGFAHRQMQDFEQAVVWYEKGSDKFRDSPDDSSLGAILLNDTGYAYLHLGRWGEATRNLNEALDIRLAQLHLDDEKLKAATPETEPKLRAARNQSAWFAGLSYNTRGEYHRYVNDLDEALRDYDEAYELFSKTGKYYWQAKCLCARGETHRRLAEQLREQGRADAVIQEHIQKAQTDMGNSLYLCERYRLDDERDTAYRRLGRLLHDLAFEYLRKGEILQAQKKLEEAYGHFKQGLEVAIKTKETLEELENLLELAFLADDAIAMFETGKVPQHYEGAVRDLEKALKKHGKDKPRLYQFQVFESLMEMEQAAIDFAHGRYDKALEGYITAYKGLGTFPGYGHARYKQHFGHLTKQIIKLEPVEQERWCKRFIEVWKKTVLPGRKGKTLADDLLPDLVLWCNKRLKEINPK